MKVALMKAAAAGLMTLSLDTSTNVGVLLTEAPTSFTNNRVKDSIEQFEKALEINPAVRERLWQYGISLYADGRYSDCANQFQFDYAKNPDDTEEVVWNYLCERRRGVDDLRAREGMPMKRADRRPVMSLVEKAYRQSDMTLLEDEVKKYESRDIIKPKTVQDEADYFYSALYLGLYQEANGRHEESSKALKKAADSLYGQRGTRDYMTSVVKVLLLRR